MNFVSLKWLHFAPLNWYYALKYYTLKYFAQKAHALKLFVWFLALIPVVVLSSRNFLHLYLQDLVYLLALLAALLCFLSPCLREVFLGSIRHHIKTLQGRFIGVVFLCFLPSIVFSPWPGAGILELVPFILTLLLLTGLAGIIPLMEDKHRRLFREIMVWGVIISLLVFFLLHHPSYHNLPVQEGYWGVLQDIYHLNHRPWFTKSATEHLGFFFPILLFALWHRLPRQPFVIFLFLFLAISLLYNAESRTTIAGLFVNICILAMGIFFLPSLSAKQKIYGLSLFLLAIMIPAPIVIEKAIKEQKIYNELYAVSEKQVTETKPTPLGIPVSAIDLERQIVWIEYISVWREKPFLGYGIGSTRHHKKAPLGIKHRSDALDNSHVKELPEKFSQRKYYHPNYFYNHLIKKGIISPQNLKVRIVNKRPRGTPFPVIQYHPHNYYLQILFEAGLIGFIPFMAFLIFFFGRSALIFWRSREVGALFILGLHGMFFAEGFFAPRFFTPRGLVMYGTAWMVILVLTRQPDRIKQKHL